VLFVLGAIAVLAGAFVFLDWRWAALCVLLLAGLGVLVFGAAHESTPLQMVGAGIVLFGWPWLFFDPRIATGVVYTFGAFATILVALLGLWSKSREPGELAEFRAKVFHRVQVQAKGIVFRARYGAASVFGAIAILLAWPSFVIWLAFTRIWASREKGGTVDTRFAAVSELYPMHVVVLGVNFAVALTVSGFHDAGLLDSAVGRSMQWVLILTTLAWATMVTIAPEHFVATLRRTEGNAYVQFIAAGLTMAGVFGIGFTALNEGNTWLGAVPISATIKQLLAFQDVIDHPTGNDLVGLARAASGGLLYLLIVRGILDFNSFERTKSDIVALANLWTRAGRPEMAIKHLRAVTTVDTESLIARSLAFLALGQIDPALRAMRECVRLAESAGLSAVGPYRELFAFAPLVCDEHASDELIVHWLDSGAEDADLCAELPGLLTVHGRKRVEELLAARGGSRQYPVTWGWMLATEARSAAERDQAIELLTANRGAEGLAGLLANVQLLVLLADETPGQVEQLVGEICVQARGIQTFEKVAVAYNFLLIVQGLAKKDNPDIHARLMPIVGELEDRLPKDHQAMVMAETMRTAVSEGMSQASRQ
jgi:hypothetical protein